ncbi:MAG: hypothetical protein AAF467_06290 [Actinomycetota bacterium]
MNDQMERDLFEMLDRRSAQAEVQWDLDAVYRDARSVEPTSSAWAWMVDVLADRRTAFAGTLAAVAFGVIGVAAIVSSGMPGDVTVVPAGEAEVPGASTTVDTSNGAGSESTTSTADVSPTSVFLSDTSTRDVNGASTASSTTTSIADAETTIPSASSVPPTSGTTGSTSGSSPTTPSTGSIPPTTGTFPETTIPAPQVTWAIHNGECIGLWDNSTSPTTITYFDPTFENCGGPATTEGPPETSPDDPCAPRIDSAGGTTHTAPLPPECHSN